MENIDLGHHIYSYTKAKIRRNTKLGVSEGHKNISKTYSEGQNNSNT